MAFNENAAEFDKIIGLVTGVVIAIFVALVLIGGVKRIGQVTEKLVPGMAAIYIVCALIVVFANAGEIPGVFASIFQGAFNPTAAVGGIVGISIKTAITKGVGRGVFSNEAGLGSAPIAHAATSEKNPVKQGLYGIFEVFMDTIVICTLTSLVVLCSGAATGNYGNNDLAGVPTAVAGFASVFGAKAGSLLLAVGLLLFATSTILGWALYGTRCAEFLFGSKIIRPYQIVFCLVVIAGAVAQIGNHDEVGRFSASNIVDGDVLLSIKGGPQATVTARDHVLSFRREGTANPRAVMEFASIRLARDLFDGRVNAMACIGRKEITVGGVISMLDNVNRILDRVALYLA